MSQSAKFQEEICNQWQECENDEIDYYRNNSATTLLPLRHLLGVIQGLLKMQ